MATAAVATAGQLPRPSQILRQGCGNRMPPPQAISLKTASQRAIQKPSLELTTRPSSVKPLNLHLGMFEVGKPLGKGKFGRVYLVRHRKSGFVCALKVLNKDEVMREGAEAHIRREIEVHSNLRHPGVVGFLGWFHDTRRIFIILEYAIGGELFRTLQRKRRFEERVAAKYVAQVAQSLSYLHSKNIMHRDLKPENILIGLHGELKLADFGYSVHAPGGRRDTLCGTLDYLPPEMLSGPAPRYTKAIDQWTLGVLTYEFLAGEAPFEDTELMTRRRIVKGDLKPLPSSVSAEARDFVYSLLNLDSSRRLSLKDALAHPWIVRHCER